MRPELHYDVVVIGAGTAGLVAGIRVAEGGARVCVLAKGVGSTHLAPGTVDVLGYSPERVERPRAALEDFVASRPDHPYALLGSDTIAEALAWFRDCVQRGPLPGYGYVGDLERNRLLPTAVGALRPSALVPETMDDGDAASLERVCIVGSRALRDFHASLCAGNLKLGGIDARAIEIDLKLDRADQNALGLARRFDDPEWRAAFAAQLALSVRPGEAVGLPAVLGIRDPHRVWTDLKKRLRCPVFEIPTLPPSVPGMRVYEILRSALRRAGGKLVLGAEVIGADREGGRLTAVATRAAGRDLRYAAPWVVLAAGGFTSGAIELDSHWTTRDRLFGLPLRGLPAHGQQRFSATYFSEHPSSRAGIAVDAELHADGTDNVLVAGAALPGAVPWREGSGEGIAITSGYRAAQLVLAASGSTAKATA